MRKNENEILSLNSEFSEFELQELEVRLETDPLAAGGLLDLFQTAAMPCGNIQVNCPLLSCIKTE